MFHGAAFRCLSIRIGRSIQGKVPEIVVGRRVELKKVETFRTQTKAATVEQQIERQLDVWHVTMRTTVNATGTGVTHQPELLSVVLTTVVLTIPVIEENPCPPSLKNADYDSLV